MEKDKFRFWGRDPRIHERRPDISPLGLHQWTKMEVKDAFENFQDYRMVLCPRAKICQICSHVHVFPKSTKKTTPSGRDLLKNQSTFFLLYFFISGFFYVSLVIVMMIGPASKPWNSRLGRETVILTSSVVLFFPVFINLSYAGTDQRRAPVNNDMQVSNCERMVMDNATSGQDNSFYLQVSNQCWI